jgi:hypothetical protein
MLSHNGAAEQMTVAYFERARVKNENTHSLAL